MLLCEMYEYVPAAYADRPASEFNEAFHRFMVALNKAAKIAEVNLRAKYSADKERADSESVS